LSLPFRTGDLVIIVNADQDYNPEDQGKIFKAGRVVTNGVWVDPEEQKAVGLTLSYYSFRELQLVFTI
jgi:hypothetical protein